MALSQPGIFNVLDSGMKADLPSFASNNQAILQQVVYTAQAAGGGTVVIPSEDLAGNNGFYIDGPILVGSPTSLSPVAIIFTGTGQGEQSVPTLIVSNSQDLFQIDTGTPEGTSGVDPASGSGDEHIGGITFQDLSIKYSSGATGGCAVHAIAAENVRVVRCVFIDCPQEVWFEDTLQCSILECTGHYEHGTNAPAPNCIQLGNDENGVAAKEIYIAGSKFLAHKQPAGTVGLLIQGAEHVRVANVRFEGFYYGIQIQPGAAISGGHNTLRHSFTNVSVYTFSFSGGQNGPGGYALTIQPNGPQSISQVVFADCEFEPSEKAAGSLGPGIYIDEGLFGSTVDNIRFISCFSSRWSGPGIEITSGSNIEINGGFYAGNASGANPSGGSGGISITGQATGIRIIGASCIGSYPYIEIDKNVTSSTQAIGVYIAGSGTSGIIIDHCDLTGNSEHAVLIGAGGLTVSNVFIRDCNASGYGTHPSDAVDIVGEVSNIQVTDCAGYNDKGATLSTSAPSGTFSNTTFGYYGPIAFYVTAGIPPPSITIDGTVTGLTSGGFTLSPGETAAITGTAAKFLAVGK